MKKKVKIKKEKIDPNELKTRDHLIVALINGATKSGVVPDKRKEQNKNVCRKKIEKDEE